MYRWLSSHIPTGTAKLAAVSLAIVLVALIGSILIIQAFYNVADFLEQDVDHSIESIVLNSETARTLVSIDHQVEMMPHMLRDASLLGKSRATITGQLERIHEAAIQSQGPMFTPQGTSLIHAFGETALKVLEGYAAISKSVMELDTYNSELSAGLDLMENRTISLMAAYSQEGRSTAGLQQTYALVPFCKQQLKQSAVLLNASISTMDPAVLGMSGNPLLDDRNSVAGSVRMLDQTIKTLTSAEERISNHALNILAILPSYMDSLGKLREKMVSLQTRHSIFGRERDAILASLEHVDTTIAATVTTIQRSARRLMGRTTAIIFVITFILIASAITAWVMVRKIGLQMEVEVNERKKAEDELRQSHNELEIRVKERTDDLNTANEQLREEIINRKNIGDHLRKLSSAIEQSPVSVIITNTEGIIEYVNPYFTALTGYTLDEVSGSTPRILKSGAHDNAYYEKLWNTITAGHVWKGEFQNRKKNGESYWEDATIAPLTDEQGGITHFIAIKEDITGRKKLEEQLLHSQKMEAVGQLAGGIAHDFNNILSAIISYAYLIEKEAGNAAEVMENARKISMVSDRAARIVGGLLAFSRKQHAQLRPFSLNELVVQMEKIIRNFLGEDIDTVVHLTRLNPRILADYAQIEQIIMNLATNARDAMPEGGSLILETERFEISRDFINAHGFGEPGTYALLTVSDSGTGIDDEIMDKIFEPFFTTKEVGKGTGLGLATVYGIVREHHGYIHVYSGSGEGTSFKIYIPVIHAASDDQPAVPKEYLGGNSETILLAEDDAPVRNATGNILRESGYTVIEAKDGADALRKYHEHKDRIDLLILDVVMPGFNGKEVHEKITGDNPGIKILFTSGYSVDVLDKKGFQQESIHYISKPVDPDAFLKKIKDMLAITS